MKQSIHELLAWRRTTLSWVFSAPELEESLTCEGLSDEATPPRLRPAVTEFRHLRRDARVRACIEFMCSPACSQRPKLPHVRKWQVDMAFKAMQLDCGRWMRAGDQYDRSTRVYHEYNDAYQLQRQQRKPQRGKDPA